MAFGSVWVQEANGTAMKTGREVKEGLKPFRGRIPKREQNSLLNPTSSPFL